MHANQMPTPPSTTTTPATSLPAFTRPGRTPDGGLRDPLAPTPQVPLGPTTPATPGDDDQGAEENGYGYGV